MAKRSPTPDNGPPTSDQPPDAKTLANNSAEFGPKGLRGKGAQNGRLGKPSQNHPGLDGVEIMVKGVCQRMLGERMASYTNEIAVLDGRIDKAFIRSASSQSKGEYRDESPSNNDAISEIHMKNALQELENIVTNERRNLERSTEKAQGTIDEVNHFKTTHNLKRDPTIPDSLRLSMGLLCIAIAVETVLNGFFFGNNMTGGILSGIFIAALISVVNVIVFGFLGATTYRQISYRIDSLRKLGGIVGLILVIFSALCFNFAVAHYRDALPSDYPPEPETVSVLASEAEREIASCWRGDRDLQPSLESSQEAWCLFLTRRYRLDGFMSYLLFLIGLAACAFGAWECWKMTDPYPGYGKLGRKRQKHEDELEEERREVLERLENKWRELSAEQKNNAFNDPIDRWERTDDAIKTRDKRYKELRTYAGQLEDSCRGAIEIYRTANRGARKEDQPVPPHWDEPWEANFNLPEKPVVLRICSYAEAEKQQKKERDILKKQVEEIRTQLKKCEAEVEDITVLENV